MSEVKYSILERASPDMGMRPPPPPFPRRHQEHRNEQIDPNLLPSDDRGSHRRSARVMQGGRAPSLELGTLETSSGQGLPHGIHGYGQPSASGPNAAHSEDITMGGLAALSAAADPLHGNVQYPDTPTHASQRSFGASFVVESALSPSRAQGLATAIASTTDFLQRRALDIHDAIRQGRCSENDQVKAMYDDKAVALWPVVDGCRAPFLQHPSDRLISQSHVHLIMAQAQRHVDWPRLSSAIVLVNWVTMVYEMSDLENKGPALPDFETPWDSISCWCQHMPQDLVPENTTGIKIYLISPSEIVRLVLGLRTMSFIWCLCQEAKVDGNRDVEAFLPIWHRLFFASRVSAEDMSESAAVDGVLSPIMGVVLDDPNEDVHELLQRYEEVRSMLNGTIQEAVDGLHHKFPFAAELADLRTCAEYCVDELRKSLADARAGPPTANMLPYKDPSHQQRMSAFLQSAGFSQHETSDQLPPQFASYAPSPSAASAVPGNGVQEADAQPADASNRVVDYAPSAGAASLTGQKRPAPEELSEDDWEKDTRRPRNKRQNRNAAQPCKRTARMRARTVRGVTSAALVASHPNPAPGDSVAGQGFEGREPSRDTVGPHGERIATPSSQAYTDVSKTAREMTRMNKKVKPQQSRKPWSQEDCQELIRAVYVYHACWSEIEKASKAEGEERDVVLSVTRDQQALRDKARIIKQEYLKTGAALPQGFDKVKLGKKEKLAIEALGKNPHRRECDIDENGVPTNVTLEDLAQRHEEHYHEQAEDAPAGTPGPPSAVFDGKQEADASRGERDKAGKGPRDENTTREPAQEQDADHEEATAAEKANGESINMEDDDVGDEKASDGDADGAPDAVLVTSRQVTKSGSLMGESATRDCIPMGAMPAADMGRTDMEDAPGEDEYPGIETLAKALD